MPLLRFCHALYPVLLTVNIISGVSACVSFQVSNKSVTDYGSYQTVLLQFKVNSLCTEGVKIVNVYGRSSTYFSPPICRFEARTGTPKPNCVYKDRSYFVMLNTSKITELVLVATLENGSIHKKTIHLQQDDATTEPTMTPDMSSSKSLSTVSGIPSTSAAATLTSGDTAHVTENMRVVSDYQSQDLQISSEQFFKTAPHSSSSPTTGIPTTVPPAPVDPVVVGFIILGGVVGLVLLIVTVLSICMGILFWKRGRLRTLPPPPPAPHNVRRAAGGAEMFQDDRESFVSVLGHDYAEIPDDTDSGKSNSTLASVSDSSMSDDCLHHIACPSSDSSLPDDYLNPVASDSEAATIREERCNSSSSSEAVMYAEERITFKKTTRKNIQPVVAEPPHNNIGKMQL